MTLHFRPTFLLIFILASHLIFAEENNAKYTYSSGAQIFSGFILKHHDVIGNLIKGHPSGIRMEIIDGVLFLDNLNTCNWTRKYVNPVLEISNPGLTKIIQRGLAEFRSTEALTYAQLKLENIMGTGDFIFEVNDRRLDVVSNEVANFYVTGSAEELNIGFYYADEFFYGGGL